MGSVRRFVGLVLGPGLTLVRAIRLPETASAGGRVAKDRPPVGLTFDNGVFMQVRQGNLPTPDLLAEE